ncbi:MAG: PilZ domain-containing protein [Deltaproteobacteria bacterium]|nr:PilZ domain-containing protein [Deltaproteobacteria bacterium]
MPYYENADCLVKLRQDKLLDIIQVVAVGELADDKLLEEALSKGAQAAIRRPLNPTELYRTVHNLIEPNPRQSLRIRVIFKTDVIYDGGLRSYFATALSDQGLFLRTTEPLPVGTLVRLRLELPAQKPLELAGEVIYQAKHSRDEFKEPGMGVKFSDIDKDLQRNLRKFVENCLTGESEEDMLI